MNMKRHIAAERLLTLTTDKRTTVLSLLGLQDTCNEQLAKEITISVMIDILARQTPIGMDFELVLVETINGREKWKVAGYYGDEGRYNYNAWEDELCDCLWELIKLVCNV